MIIYSYPLLIDDTLFHHTLKYTIMEDNKFTHVALIPQLDSYTPKNQNKIFFKEIKYNLQMIKNRKEYNHGKPLH